MSREVASALLFCLGIGVIVGAKLAKGAKGEAECAHCVEQAAQARLYETVRAKQTQPGPNPFAPAPQAAPRASAPVYDPADVTSHFHATDEALADRDQGYRGDLGGARVGPRKDEPPTGGVVYMADGTVAPYIPPPVDAA